LFDKKGASSIEYVLMVMLIAAVIIIGVAFFGSVVKSLFNISF
jgi:Flp pilus assembly pilin Flp